MTSVLQTRVSGKLTTRKPLAMPPLVRHATPTRRHVLIGVSDPRNCALTQLLLEGEGWDVIVLDIFDWLSGEQTASVQPDAVLLEAWALRDPVLARRAMERLALFHAPLVLLTEDLDDLGLGQQLGAAVTLPILFDYDALVSALQQALRTRQRHSFGAEIHHAHPDRR